MSDLPTPIRRQVEAVEALYQQPTSEDAQPATQEGDGAPAAELAPQVQAAAPEETAAPEPAAPEAAEPEAPAAPPKDSEATWEQRYRTLQGLNNRNAADFKQRLGDKDREIADLKRQVEKLSAAPAPQPADPKDVETFGEDLVGMVQRTIENAMGRALAQYDGRFQQLEQRLDGTAHAATRTAEELFLERLAEQVPDYAQVNVDDGFLAWLAEDDGVYGVPRQEALDRAAAAMDVDRVARVFKAYKATRMPAAPTPDQAAPADPRAQAKAQLEKQVAPRATAPSPTTAQPAKRVYSAAEVTAFYDSARRGHYRGRDEDFAREEAAINLALAEGRITP